MHPKSFVSNFWGAVQSDWMRIFLLKWQRFIGLFCSFKAMTKTKVTKRAEFQARNPALIFMLKKF